MKVRIVTSIDQRLLSPTAKHLKEMVKGAGMEKVLDILVAIQRISMNRHIDTINRDTNDVLSRIFRVHTAQDVEDRYQKVITKANLITFHIGLDTDQLVIRCAIELKRNKESLWDCYFFMPPRGARAHELSMGGWMVLA